AITLDRLVDDPRAERLSDFDRPVRRAIVPDHDFTGDAETIEGAKRFFDAYAERVFLVEAGNDRRHQRLGRRLRRRPAARRRQREVRNFPHLSPTIRVAPGSGAADIS